tara:strand:+ start:1367 stop:1666 length:300 start_codon:yes stop_codon:yes gene_type:complete
MGRDALREENKKLKEEYDELRHQSLRLMKRLEEYDYGFDWTVEHRKLNDENLKLKEDKKRLSIYLAEIGEDCDCRDEGARATEFKYAEWFNKITNNEFL